MKAVPTDRLVRCLRSTARELAKPHEARDEDFEEDAAAWAMREAAKRLQLLEKRVAGCEKKLALLKEKQKCRG